MLLRHARSLLFLPASNPRAIAKARTLPCDMVILDLEDAVADDRKAEALDQALDALDSDRAFLKAGGVMTDDMIDAYIGLKMEEVQRLRQATHPLEFEMYYSV